MTTSDIVRLRLHHQQLVQPQFKTPAAVVEWLGAVQAQDYLHSLWGVGQRLSNSTEGEMEQALAQKAIVRSWPMRGTLHFVPAADLRWMLTHLTPRIIKKCTTMFRRAGLDKTVFSKSRKIVADALQGGVRLTREQLYEKLEKKKISTADVRGLHILFVLAQEKLICFGPREGKQHTFTLMDDWLPPSKEILFDEALGQLAMRYFTSHGPAQLKDLAWWAGLTLTEARAGLESVKSKLVCETVEGKAYWFSPDVAAGKTIPNVAHFLSVYDEYGIAYKDRTALIDPGRKGMLGGRDFLNMLVIKGRMVGSWKRTLETNQVNIALTTLGSLHAAEKAVVEKAVLQYGRFLGLTPKLLTRRV